MTVTLTLNWLAVVADDGLGEGAGVVLEQAPAAVDDRQDRPGAVGEGAEDADALGREAEDALHADAEGRAMADHDGELPGLEAGRDPVDGGAHPVRDHARGLAVGRVPGRPLAGVALADLGVGEALPDAAGPLAEVLVLVDRQAGEPAERCGGLLGAGQVRREDRARHQGGEAAGGVFGLGLAGLVERDVGLALESALDVPGRLPVPPEHEPPGRAQLWMPFAASAASGSAISGQSFQMRSRA